MAKEKKVKVNYIDNAKFLDELVKYKAACDEAKKQNKPDPPIPQYIGECFMKIAVNLSRAPNFLNYSFKEDMIGDGVENCLMYFRNFDPEKSKNPFSYFTQIIWFAFIRKIGKEKKQSYVKYKMTEQSGIDFELESQNGYDDDSSHSRHPHEGLYDNISESIYQFEEKMEKKKKKRKKKDSLPEDK